MRFLMNTYLKILLGGLVLAGLASSAGAQAPFIDGASSSESGTALPREAPRAVLLGLPFTSLFHSGNRVETARLDVDRLLDEDAEAMDGPARVAVVQDFAPKSGDSGEWTPLPDGGWLWTMTFVAPDANAIRLRIRPWNPPPGAELSMFNARDPEESLGPFTSSYPSRLDEFWTGMIYSDEVNVEYYVPPGVDHRAPESQITVDGLLNQYRDLLGPSLRELSCHLDVTCYPVWANEADGVAALSVVANPYGFFCSGGMLNRSPQDWTALFMTANHCGVTTGNESSVLVTWFYQTPSCNGTPPSPATLPQTLSVAALVNDPSTDFCLFGLRDSPLGGVMYLGWDANYWPNGSSATLIAHPDGSYKRITFGTKNADVTSCIPAAAWFINVPHNSGEDEPGSSGGPLFDSSRRVRGTASCASWSCASADVIEAGRFDVAWPLLQPYLLPTDPVYVNWSFGGTELGTVSQPFNRVKEGIFGVQRSSNLYVEAGSYDEQMVIDKAMTIHARNGTTVIGN